MISIPRTATRGAAANLGVCILAGCALIAAATWASGDSTPRRLARGTHVGVPPSDTVLLVSQGKGTSLKFYSASPDGTLAASEYAVPAGMRLIVTDVEFASSYSNHQGAGMTGRVFIENRTTSTTRTIAALIPPGTGGQSGKASPGTGFSVSAGGRLVADALYSTGASYTISISSSYGYPQNVNDHHLFVLRGYLVTEE